MAWHEWVIHFPENHWMWSYIPSVKEAGGYLQLPSHSSNNDTPTFVALDFKKRTLQTNYQKSVYITPSAVITRSNITRYFIYQCGDWGRISIRAWTHKINPIDHPNGLVMGWPPCQRSDMILKWRSPSVLMIWFIIYQEYLVTCMFVKFVKFM